MRTRLLLSYARNNKNTGRSYVLLYFLRGSLPWQGLKAHTKKQKCRMIEVCKTTTPSQELCRGHPGERWWQANAEWFQVLLVIRTR